MSHAAANSASGRPYIRSTFLTMFLPNAIVIDSVSWVYLYHYEVRVCLDGVIVICQWLCESGHFHSCCPSPVLNIVLEISRKILYIAFHVHIILVISYLFKASYKRNIEQRYLPRTATNHILLTSWASCQLSLALEKWQGLQDLHIFIFAFRNMKTIFFTLLAFLGHQKHKKCWFQASYATVNSLPCHQIPVHTI
jgi:hypothetical protein